MIYLDIEKHNFERNRKFQKNANQYWAFVYYCAKSLEDLRSSDDWLQNMWNLVRM